MALDIKKAAEAAFFNIPKLLGLQVYIAFIGLQAANLGNA